MVQQYKKNKNILIWHWGRRGGGPKYTLELVRELSKYKSLNLHISISMQSELINEFRKLNLKCHFVDTYYDAKSAIIKSFKIKSIRKNFWKYIDENNIDILICTMSHLWNVPILLMKNHSLIYFLVLHDGKPHEGENYFFRNFLLKIEINKANKIITLSNHVKNYLLSNFSIQENNISVIPHGLFNYSLKKSNCKSNSINILFFGRILPYKGLDNLLVAFEDIRKKYKHVKLKIVGHGDISNYKLKKDNSKNISIYNKWVCEEMVGKFFSEAYVVVLPYKNASQSGVIATAYAFGVPVIINPVGGLSEQVIHEKTGLISKGMNPKYLSNSISRLIDDKILYKKLCNGVKMYSSRNLSWSKIAKQFKENILI